MAKATPLTIVEQRAILGFRQDGLDAKDIAKAVGRTKAAVEKYLTSLAEEDVEVEVEVSDFEDRADEGLFPEKNEHIPEEMEDRAVNRLMASGLSELDAKAALNKVRIKLKEQDRYLTLVDLDALVVSASKQVSAKDSMVRKKLGRNTSGGREGATVLTSASSMRMDHDKEKRPTVSRSAKGAIYTQDKGVI